MRELKKPNQLLAILQGLTTPRDPIGGYMRSVESQEGRELRKRSREYHRETGFGRGDRQMTDEDIAADIKFHDFIGTQAPQHRRPDRPEKPTQEMRRRSRESREHVNVFGGMSEGMFKRLHEQATKAEADNAFRFAQGQPRINDPAADMLESIQSSLMNPTHDETAEQRAERTELLDKYLRWSFGADPVGGGGAAGAAGAALDALGGEPDVAPLSGGSGDDGGYGMGTLGDFMGGMKALVADPKGYATQNIFGNLGASVVDSLAPTGSYADTMLDREGELTSKVGSTIGRALHDPEGEFTRDVAGGIGRLLTSGVEPDVSRESALRLSGRLAGEARSANRETREGWRETREALGRAGETRAAEWVDKNLFFGVGGFGPASAQVPQSPDSPAAQKPQGFEVLDPEKSRDTYLIMAGYNPAEMTEEEKEAALAKIMEGEGG
jgi:hypothetical protein